MKTLSTVLLCEQCSMAEATEQCFFHGRRRDAIEVCETCRDRLVSEGEYEAVAR